MTGPRLPGPPPPPARPEEWAADELAKVLPQAKAGSPSAARRVAELYEVLGGGDITDQARWWWRRAAELGDGDAIDYVKTIIEGEGR